MTSTIQPPADARPPGPRRAAFFGLDKTLIPGSSLLLLAQALHQRNVGGAEDLLGFAWQHLVFSGGGPERPSGAQSLTDAALAFVHGRHRPELRAMAREIAEERIVPRVFPEMTALIEEHRSAGDLTFLATAGPSELAESVAEGLGMTGALGTAAAVDEAEQYNGRLGGAVLHGRHKAAAVEAHAAAEGIDLDASLAYSDSINDLPLLELVGAPRVVNPDRQLRKVAGARDWPVHDLRGGRLARPFRPARPAQPTVADRLEALGLWAGLEPDPEGATKSGNAVFIAEDPARLAESLESSGRFKRDTRLGAIFHGGKVSWREVSPTDSLHITLDKGNRVSAHVDLHSPLAEKQPEGRSRYSLARVAVHNLSGMAADMVRLVSRRRGRRGSDGEKGGTPRP